MTFQVDGTLASRLQIQKQNKILGVFLHFTYIVYVLNSHGLIIIHVIHVFVAKTIELTFQRLGDIQRRMI